MVFYSSFLGNLFPLSMTASGQIEANYLISVNHFFSMILALTRKKSEIIR